MQRTIDEAHLAAIKLRSWTEGGIYAHLSTNRPPCDWTAIGCFSMSKDLAPILARDGDDMLIATAMSGRATGRTGRPSITVLDECWFLLDSVALAPEVVQLYRTARKRNSSVWGIEPDGRRARVGTEFQPRVHGPGILENAHHQDHRQQPGDVTPLINHLNLNPVALNQVKGFGAPRKGRGAEVLLAIGEKAETTQTIRIVPTPLSYWICTTFPRERKYRSWFLRKHEEMPLLQCYQELSRKFPQGLADVSLLPEEVSGEVNGAVCAREAVDKRLREHAGA